MRRPQSHITRRAARNPVESLESRVLFSAGGLDSTFGAGGFALADFGKGTATTADVAVDAGRGRILAAGTFQPAVVSRAMAARGATPRGALAAFKLDGTPDTTFSGDGKLLTDLPNLDHLRVLPDGRFYADSLRRAPDGSRYIQTVARFNRNGSYDTTFSGDGKLEVSVAGVIDATRDGKLVVVSGPRVARYNVDGTPDTTLDRDGVVIARFGPGDDGDHYLDYRWDSGGDPAVMDDGRIVIVGTAFSGGDDKWDGAAMRLNPDGSFDNTFYGDGRTIISSGSVDDYGTVVTVGPHGEIYGGAGYSEYEAYPVRLNPEAPGVFRVSREIEADYAEITDIEVASDGRVFVTATHDTLGDYAPPPFFLAAYLPDGTFQPGFGGTAAGRFVHPVGSQFALDPQDRILMAPHDARLDGALSVARYLDEGGDDASGSAAVVGGTLRITGTGRADEIRVAPAPGGKLAVTVNGYRREFATTSVAGINIDALAGDDVVAIDPLVTIPAAIVGADGNDTLAGGGGDDRIDGGGNSDDFNANESLSGGPGNDTLLGGTGADRLDGGAGDDRLEGGPGFDALDGGPGADYLFGGADVDTASYFFRTAGVVVTINDVADDGEPGERDDVRGDVEEVFGGDGNDRLTGSDADDTLVGYRGNDTLVGAGGNDVLFGMEGDDALQGGEGIDRLDDRYGSNTFDGGPGLDTINDVREDGVPSNGDIALVWPGGNLFVVGDNGDDVIRITRLEATPTPLVRVSVDYGPRVPGDPPRSRQVDVPYSDVQSIYIEGLNGNDRIDFSGLPFPAYVLAGPGDDVVRAGDGNDTLFGGGGNDQLFGDGGDDRLDGEFGADTLSGGPGVDAADYGSRFHDLIISLNNKADDGERGERDDVRDDVEDVLGGSGDDRISGSSANNRLTGGAGNDTLSGGGGKDQLRGNAGNDYLIARADGAVDFLDGGSGNDRALKDSDDFAQFVEQLLA